MKFNIKKIFCKTHEEIELLNNNKCLIKLDSEGKVRIENLESADYEKIVCVNDLVMDLNNYPMSYKSKKKYANDIKNIYAMALNNKESEAKAYTEKLKSIMDEHLELIRSVQYTVPATIIFIIVIMLSFLLRRKFNMDMYNIFIFSSIGGILSLLLKPEKFHLDYKVQTYIIIIESIKRVIISIVMGTIGYVAVNSNIIFANYDILNNKYIVYLIIIFCAYSSTFIPNILDNMSKDKNNK